MHYRPASGYLLSFGGGRGGDFDIHYRVFYERRRGCDYGRTRGACELLQYGFLWWNCDGDHHPWL